MVEGKLLSAEPISAYFELSALRAELFTPSKKIPLVMDEEQMRKFSQEKKLAMGVVFNNFPYYYVVADLCRGSKGLYRYSRVIYCNEKSNGVVAVVVCGRRFGLITKFHHVTRSSCIEFPRGFSEKPGLSPQENICREVSEELGIREDQCRVRYLGEVRADTGLAAGKAQVYAAEIPDDCPIVPEEEEGIYGFDWVDEDTLRSMIKSGEITDGFTLSGYALYCCAG